MKISLFVHDLASNPIVRAAPIAFALQKLGHEIEIIGFLISGNEVYKPYKNKFQYKTLSSRSSMFDVISKSNQLAKLASGEIMYAFKPFMSSLLPAFLASKKKNTKLLLDVEDDDYNAESNIHTSFSISKHLLEDWGVQSRKSMTLTKLLTYAVADGTVVSRALRKKFGGNILLHGPNEELFNPKIIEDKNACLAKFGMNTNKVKILFAGYPRAHKGLDLIVEAIDTAEINDFQLVLAGAKDSKEFIELKQQLGEKCHLVGWVSNEEMPALLQAIDIVATPQKKTIYTESQVPAKLLEGMAMAKIIIVSNVGDLPEILKAESEIEIGGWVMTENTGVGFRNVLKEILENKEEVERRRQNARNVFLQTASVEANAKKLSKIIENISN
jgi:glycosyltransferase involved in cell wall biosynthesis